MLHSKSQWGELAVSLDSKKLTSPRVVTVRFLNTGANELKPEAIRTAPGIRLPEGKIVAASIVLQSHDDSPPDEIKVTAQLPGPAVDAGQLLINQGDALVFQLLIEETDKPVEPVFRADGFTFIERTVREADFLATASGSFMGAVARAAIRAAIPRL